jgi:hypothetical protein
VVAGVAVGCSLLAVVLTLVCVVLMMRRHYARQRGGSRHQHSYDGRAAAAPPRETSFWVRLMRSGSSHYDRSHSMRSSDDSGSGSRGEGPLPSGRTGVGAPEQQPGSARSKAAETLTSRLKSSLAGKAANAPGAGGGEAVTLVATDVEGRCEGA